MKNPNFDQAERLAAGLAALAHPARLRILNELSRSPACCCKDVVGRLDLAQSTVSQHLKVLTESGLVAYAPDRQRSRYSLDHAALGALSQALSTLAASCAQATTKCCEDQDG